MDVVTLDLAIFLVATFAAALVVIVQGVAVWKLRHALQWDRLWPFLLGGLLGVPIGVVVLACVMARSISSPRREVIIRALGLAIAATGAVLGLAA